MIFLLLLKNKNGVDKELVSNPKYYNKHISYTENYSK